MDFSARLLSFSLISSSSSNHNSSTCRLGTITLEPRNTKHDDDDDDDQKQQQQTRIETPNFISNAPRGQVRHLTSDNFKRSTSTSTTAVHLSLEHFLEFQPPSFSKAPFPLSRFLGLQQHDLISISLRDPNRIDDVDDDDINDKTKKIPSNGDDYCVALGGRGVVKVSAKDYLNWTVPRPPDLLFALADEPRQRPTSRKRLEKSIKRSLNWLRELTTASQSQSASDRTNLFATLVGSDNVDCRKEFSLALLGTSSSRASSSVSDSTRTTTIDSCLSGYVLSSISSYTSSLLSQSLEPLPRSKLRIGLNPKGPHEILKLIQKVGIDLFVEDWSQQCSNFGIALDFEFPVTTIGSNQEEEIGINLYETRHSFSFEPLSNSSLATTTGELDHPFGPFPPSKSYVHHLLLAHEMTSHVILSLHNQILISNFFESIRKVLHQRGTEVFDKEVLKFEEKYKGRGQGGGGGEYDLILRGKKDWELVEKVRGKGSLKDKVIELGKEKDKEKEKEHEKVLVRAVVEEGLKTKVREQ